MVPLDHRECLLSLLLLDLVDVSSSLISMLWLPAFFLILYFLPRTFSTLFFTSTKKITTWIDVQKLSKLALKVSPTNGEIDIFNSICSQLTCNCIHNMHLTTGLAHPEPKATGSKGPDLFRASLCLAGVLLIFAFGSYLPFSIMKNFCMKGSKPKFVRCSGSLPFAPTLSLPQPNPFIVNKEHWQFSSKTV